MNKITSIIIPIWIVNEEKKKYVEWMANSLCLYTDSPFELVIIDNESTENSFNFIKEVFIQFEKNEFCQEVRIFQSEKNIGFAGAWDMGIKNSNGEYCCIINDDLVFSDGWLSKMIAHLDDKKVAVGPTSNFVSGLQDIRNTKKDDYEERVNFLIGLCLLIKKSALDKIYDNNCYIDSIFFPGGSEEIDVCIRLKKVGYDLVIAKDVFIHHFGNKSLEHIDEFNKSNELFYQKRLNILASKHSAEWVKAITDFQHCPLVVIGIPNAGSIDPMFLSNYPWLLKESFKEFGLDNVVPMIGPRNMVHMGRTEIVRKAIMTGAKYLFFIDDDMIVPSSIIKKLIKHDKAFVSGVAYMRRPPYSPCVYGEELEDGKLRHVYSRGQGLIEVNATGLSCALIKIDAIIKIMKARDSELRSRGGLFYFNEYGEDLNFCKDLKYIGEKIYVDTNIQVEHIGSPKIINWQTYENNIKHE